MVVVATSIVTHFQLAVVVLVVYQKPHNNNRVSSIRRLGESDRTTTSCTRRKQELGSKSTINNNQPHLSFSVGEGASYYLKKTEYSKTLI